MSAHANDTGSFILGARKQGTCKVAGLLLLRLQLDQAHCTRAAGLVVLAPHQRQAGHDASQASAATAAHAAAAASQQPAASSQPGTWPWPSKQVLFNLGLRYLGSRYTAIFIYSYGSQAATSSHVQP
jgi:hypothetical protein